jgi:hypothetical protein
MACYLALCNACNTYISTDEVYAWVPCLLVRFLGINNFGMI